MIECRSVDGDIKLDTSYGDVNCKNIISDRLTAKSSYGDINVAYAEDASCEIQAELATSYGDIRLTVPAEFAGQVDLGTNYGSIRSDLPITVQGKISSKRINGTIGEGNGKLCLKTSYGSIKLAHNKPGQ